MDIYRTVITQKVASATLRNKKYDFNFQKVDVQISLSGTKEMKSCQQGHIKRNIYFNH